MTTVSLVRHGRVENPRQVYYGRLAGFGLAEEGRMQAVAAGRFLATGSIAAIYHSPMQRAAETAALVRDQLSAPAPLVECALLNEIHSSYDGRTAEEMERRQWDFYGDIVPPYETPDDILARILAFFREMRAAHPGQHVAAVTHGDPIAFAVLWACGRALSAAGRRRLAGCGVPEEYPAPASISTFTFGEDGDGQLVAFRYHCPYDAPGS